MNKKCYRHLTYNPFAVKLTRWIITPFLRWFFRISAHGIKVLRVRPPYIMLASHRNVWDPLVYNSYIKVPLHFLVSDAEFRLPIMRRVLALAGSIAKKKSAVDINAILETVHVLKVRKEALCVFPEGVNVWDGRSSEIAIAIAKLIKRMGVTVLCARSHGAYLSRPRWARGARRGTWDVHYSLCLTPQRIENLSAEDILTCIKNALCNDEYENQNLNKKYFISPHAAQYVERVLFACPYCESVQSLISEKTFFHCRVCCNMWRFRADGYIQRRKHGPHMHMKRNVETEFVTISQWNAWQQKFLEHLLEPTSTSCPSIVFYDENVRLFWGKKRLVAGRLRGSCELTHDEFIFTPLGKRHFKQGAFRVAVSEMKSINVQNNEKLEWTSKNGITYQLKSRNPCVNMYKYMCAVRHLQNKQI